VVARVNGKSVLLSQLEARHDLKYLSRPMPATTSLDRLRGEYGQVLTELVVQQLVDQFLAEQGLVVTDAEIQAAEEQVRADYPQGAFEQMLIEEYIDLDIWREQLRATLNRDKLFQKVLRPEISIDYSEVDDYYRQNIADFYLRPRVRFLLIQGQNHDAVLKIVDMAQAEPDPEQLSKRFDHVDVHAYTLHEDNIPPKWQTLLEGMEVHQASPVLAQGDGNFLALMLLERAPGRMVDPAQAYPLVEHILVERKLRDAFAFWLEGALKSAEIEVNREVLPRVRNAEESLIE